MTAIFLLSNQLHDQRDGDQGLELLCSLFDHDAALMKKLLSSRVPTMRAAWESLFAFTNERRRKDRFWFLTDIGIHNRWLNPMQAGKYLSAAVEMDCYETVESIVVYCSDSDCSDWWRDSLDAILAACWKGSVECAKLLIRHCDVDSMLADSIFILGEKDPGNATALELFLADGADVDQYSTGDELPRIWRELLGRHEITNATRPTILDEAFYFDRSLFDKLVTFSTVPYSIITRTRLLLALEDGPQTLRDYLSAPHFATSFSNWQHVPSMLELLLAEQFEIPENIDLRVVRSLYELGVDFHMPTIRLDIQDLLHKVCLRSAQHEFAGANDGRELLGTLLKFGAAVGEKDFAAAVAKDGLGGLEYLAPHLRQFPIKAARAVAAAARFNNFEAVELLFRRGADPQAFIAEGDQIYSIQAVATGALNRAPHSQCSLDMIQVLARHGAQLVLTPEDPKPFDFTNHVLQNSVSNTFTKVKYVLGQVEEGRTSSTLPACLLESCLIPRIGYLDLGEGFIKERLEIFEYLYKLRGAEVSPGSPLAALVAARGREDLVRDVLSSGSDLNAYWADGLGQEFTPLQVAARNADETLVRLFLNEGAKVNSPAGGLGGCTALQAICGWSPATEEEHQSKMRICRLLLEKGADANAQYGRNSHTALAFAAIAGDLELAKLLLGHGAAINALSGKHSKGTALDEAAHHGRLDMVKFLLSSNALSSNSSGNGYDGAISIAERYNYLAVADLIRRHAAEVEAGNFFNPELWRRKMKYDLDASNNVDESPSSDGCELSSCGGAQDMDGPGEMSELTDKESSDRGRGQS